MTKLFHNSIGGVFKLLTLLHGIGFLQEGLLKVLNFNQYHYAHESRTSFSLPEITSVRTIHVVIRLLGVDLKTVDANSKNLT